MAIQHSNITDPKIHEPKGASTALIDTIYVANGSGSGTWKTLPYSDTVVMEDVSTASFVIMPIPIEVEIETIVYTLWGAITGADSTITVTNGASESLGTQVIAFSGSGEGSTFIQIPSGNNIVTPLTDKYLKFATNGNSTGSVKLSISVRAKVK